MVEACRPFADVFVTPMAAVAGAVADELLAHMTAAAPLERAFVNDGGDIAVLVAPGHALDIGVAGEFSRGAMPVLNGAVRLDAASGVGGIATSGARGRSFSLGIADSVTTLARDAATADVAATLVANAVNVDSPAIRRRPARELDPDSDLRDLPVTVSVGAADVRRDRRRALGGPATCGRIPPARPDHRCRPDACRRDAHARQMARCRSRRAPRGSLSPLFGGERLRVRGGTAARMPAARARRPSRGCEEPGERNCRGTGEGNTMARIAVGGFHHETNCFVAERTDFAYFASHRDRPPLVRGKDVIEWLGDTSFALSGFLRDMSAAPRDRAAAVDQRRRRRARHRRRLRADRRRAGRAAVRGACRSMPSTSTCTAPWSASRSRTARASCCGACAPPSGPACRSPSASTITPTSRPRWWRSTDSLVGYRTYPHVDRPETGQHAARAMSLLLERGRPHGPRAAQAAVPDPAQRPVHAGRAVEGRGRPLGGRRGRPGQPLLPRGLPALRPLLVRAGGDRARLEPGGGRPRGRRARPRDRLARARVRRADGLARATACARRWRSRARRRGRWCSATRRTIRAAAPPRTPRACSETLVRLGAEGAVVGYLCDARGRGRRAQGGRGRRHHHRARRALRPRGRQAASRAPSASPGSAPARCAPRARSPAGARSISGPWRCSPSAASASP